MPSIDFYHMPESPPCRAVSMLANMIPGLQLNSFYINLAEKEHLKDDFIEKNPLHKVPFIIDGDLKLGESRAILCYLVNRYMPADNTLYPHDPVKRAQIDEMLYFDIGTLFRSSSKLLRPLLIGSEELDSEDEKEYRVNLAYIDSRLGSIKSKFLLGDHLTIADISLAASFTFPEACGYNLKEFKNLCSYIDRLKESIPQYHEVNDIPVKNMREFIDSKRR